VVELIFVLEPQASPRCASWLSTRCHLGVANIPCAFAYAGAILRTAVVGRWGAWLATGVAASHVGTGLSLVPSGM
jgi:hypothetical protein